MPEGGSIMSDVFRPYEKLVEITIVGKTFLVPERNSLLRAFQFISPETVPYGRFCWNQECQYCRVSCKLPDDDQSRPILSCKFLVSEGMAISDLAPELAACLRSKLGLNAHAAAPAESGLSTAASGDPDLGGSSSSPRNAAAPAPIPPAVD
jgi:hypothetical protein